MWRRNSNAEEKMATNSNATNEKEGVRLPLITMANDWPKSICFGRDKPATMKEQSDFGLTIILTDLPAYRTLDGNGFSRKYKVAAAEEWLQRYPDPNPKRWGDGMFKSTEMWAWDILAQEAGIAFPTIHTDKEYGTYIHFGIPISPVFQSDEALILLIRGNGNRDLGRFGNVMIRPTTPQRFAAAWEWIRRLNNGSLTEIPQTEEVKITAITHKVITRAQNTTD